MADYNINAITRRVVFTGSAGLGPYAFSFEILDQDDLAVYFNATSLTITTDYTVTINANGTGSVNIVTGSSVPSTPTASDQIVIVGARDIERVTDFVTAGDLLASSLNEQLDALTIFDQQLAEEGARTMRAPAYDPALVADGGTLDMTLPTAASRAGKTLAFDSDGNPTVGEDIGNWRGNWAASVSYTVRDLVKDPTNDNVYRVNTAHTSSGSAPISSNADVAKFDLVVDASAAAASAAAAAASAAAAAADAVSTAADVVSTNADVVLTNADVVTTGNNVTAAQAAQAAAELAADNFDDTYLGAKASDPTVDNDGNALTIGDLYFNTATNVLKVYNGSAWQVAATSTAGLLASANDLSDLNNAATARVNLGSTAVGDAVFIAASVAAAQQALDVEVGVDVQAYDADTAKLDVAQTFTAAQVGSTQTASITGSTTLDFSVYQNFVLTLTGTVTLANPTTETAGQSGFITFIQDGTGSRTVSLGTDYETAGASGLTLSTAASTTDIVPYVVTATGRILLGAPQLAFA
jgi:hypothetical protein